MMETFTDRLYRLARQKNTTISHLAESVGLSQTGISNWKKRGSIPPADIAIDLARFFGVSVEYLILGEDQPENNNIYDKLSRLSDRDREIVFTLIEVMLQS